MNGMKKKAQHLAAQKRWTEDGIPRDSKDWTVADWAILRYGMEAIKHCIAERHRKERKGDGPK